MVVEEEEKEEEKLSTMTMVENERDMGIKMILKKLKILWLIR